MTAFWVVLGVAGWLALGYAGYRLAIAGWLHNFPVTYKDRWFFRAFITLGVSSLGAGLFWWLLNRHETPSTYHDGPVAIWPKGMEQYDAE